MNKSMDTLYRCFAGARTTFFIILCMVFMAGRALASSPYTIEGVKVDVTAESALAARDQAFAKAQGDAFMLLAQNLLPPERFSSVKAPAASALAGMIQDYEITEEKISRTRYNGTYTFRFRAAPVHRYLGVAGTSQPLAGMGMAPGAPDADVYPSRRAAHLLLVLPFYRQGADMVLWSADNPWLRAWSEAMRRGSPLLLVPIGDLADVNDITDNQALSYDRQRLRNMVARYGAAEAVLAVALPGTPEPGTMSVHIYRTDRGDPELVRKIFVPSGNLEEAVSRTWDALHSDWSNNVPPVATTSAPPSTVPRVASGGQAYLGSVRFRNLQEWAGLQRDISRIPGVSRVAIQSLSPREAILEITHAGDVNQLQSALQGYSVTLVGHQPPAPAGAAMPAPASVPRAASSYSNSF